MQSQEMKLKILNGSAKMIASRVSPETNDIRRLVHGVMEYMMDTGTDLVHLDNLYVQVDFQEATVMSFLIDDGAGRIIDIESYTVEFYQKLSANRKSALNRLLSDISAEDHGKKMPPQMVFGNN